MSNKYGEALESAGAYIHAIKYFGTYQGDIWAKVTYKEKTGWVRLSYGSCSGCDAFEAEFGWDEDIAQERLAAFGKDYLDEILTQEEAEKKASEDISWDLDAEKALDFIKKNKIKNKIKD